MRIIITLWIAVSGQATYYNPGVFAEVWANRSSSMPQCQDCIGYAAMLDCKDLGKRIWVTYNDETVGPLYVIDCANRRHRAALAQKGWVVDLPFWLAKRWSLTGPVTVTVSYTHRAIYQEQR